MSKWQKIHAMDQIFTDYPTGSKQMAYIFFAILTFFLTSCWVIYEYLIHP